MMYYCYILQSQTTGKLYIGQTNNLQDRISRHNAGANPATRNKGPWELLFSLGFETRADAMAMERKRQTNNLQDRIRRHNAGVNLAKESNQ